MVFIDVKVKVPELWNARPSPFPLLLASVILPLVARPFVINVKFAAPPGFLNGEARSRIILPSVTVITNVVPIDPSKASILVSSKKFPAGALTSPIASVPSSRLPVNDRLIIGLAICG